MNKENFAV